MRVDGDMGVTGLVSAPLACGVPFDYGSVIATLCRYLRTGLRLGCFIWLLPCCPVWFLFLGIVLFPLFVSGGLCKLLQLELFRPFHPEDLPLGTYLC